MQTKKTIQLDKPIYKVVTITPLHAIFLITGNQFIAVDIITGHKVVHTVSALTAILDLEYDNGLVYLAGTGHLPVTYSLAEMRQISGSKPESHTAYSAIKKIDDLLYCANVYAETIEVWKDNFLIRSFSAGTFVKQLRWQEHTRTLMIAVAESEDSGYLLFYHIDEQQQIHGLDVYVAAHFSISSADFTPDQTTLLITGGFPPLNIQVHTYPDLHFKKELLLAEDYTKDAFGNDIGYAYNLQYQFVNDNEFICPYTGGSILLINYITNEYRVLLDSGEIWIYIQLIAGELVGVTAAGTIYLFEHSFTPPAQTTTIALSTIFKQIDCDQPISTRYTITSEDEPDDLQLQNDL